MKNKQERCVQCGRKLSIGINTHEQSGYAGYGKYICGTCIRKNGDKMNKKMFINTFDEPDETDVADSDYFMTKVFE